MIKYKHGGITHRLAYCKTCNWNNDGYKEALRKAKDHCEKTGHNITMDRFVNNIVYWT
jgi:hypothetical protein